jgi:superfamily II DNA helicase RecQ
MNSSIIILPTSSSKIILFFLFAVIAVNQIVIIIIPFIALINNLILRVSEVRSGSSNSLIYKEWTYKGSIETLL